MKNVLHLGLSYACNMKCRHCFVNRKKDMLGLQDYYRILDKVYDLGVFLIYYTYGEPLLSNIFIEVTKYAREKGFVQILMTNGYFVDENWIKIIKDNGINEVCVSLDHIESEIHDNNRGIKGAYKHVIDAIDMLHKHNVSVGISTTINNQNVGCMKEILNLAVRKGMNYVSFLRQRNGDICQLSQENKKVYLDNFKHCVTNEEINVHFHDIELLPTLIWLKKNNIINEEIYEKYYEMNRCHKKRTLSIEPDGSVSDCNLMPFVIGNVINNTLEKMIKERECENENSFCCCSISR